MKTKAFKIVFILLLSFTLVKSSDAYGRYNYRCTPRGYYAPRAYYSAPRYYAPAYYAPVAVAPYYGRVFVPGHYFVNRYGARVYARGFYR
jgi:hypothetical protein